MRAPQQLAVERAALRFDDRLALELAEASISTARRMQASEIVTLGDVRSPTRLLTARKIAGVDFV